MRQKLEVRSCVWDIGLHVCRGHSRGNGVVALTMNIEAEVRPSLSPREKSSGFVLVASGGQDEVKCVILSVGSEYCLVETGRGGGEWGGAING